MEKLKQEISKPTLINVENLSVETSENQYFIGINRPPKEEHNNKTLDLVIKTNIIHSKKNSSLDFLYRTHLNFSGLH